MLYGNGIGWENKNIRYSYNLHQPNTNPNTNKKSPYILIISTYNKYKIAQPFITGYRWIVTILSSWTYHDRVSEHREMSRVNRGPLIKNKKPRSGHGCSVHTDNDCRVNKGRDQTLHGKIRQLFTKRIYLKRHHNRTNSLHHFLF